MNEVLEKLEDTEELEQAKLALCHLAEKCLEVGCSPSTFRLIVSAISPELPNCRKKKRRHANVRSLSGDFDTLYSKYIEKCTLYADSSQPEDIVRPTQSHFGRDGSISRSFSRSKRSLLLVPPQQLPGPGAYDPNPLSFRQSSPAHSLTKAAPRMKFKVNGAPGPGAYRPSIKFLSKY